MFKNILIPTIKLFQICHFFADLPIFCAFADILHMNICGFFVHLHACTGRFSSLNKTLENADFLKIHVDCPKNLLTFRAIATRFSASLSKLIDTRLFAYNVERHPAPFIYQLSLAPVINLLVNAPSLSHQKVDVRRFAFPSSNRGQADDEVA